MTFHMKTCIFLHDKRAQLIKELYEREIFLKEVIEEN
jgi:hypothetical protein